MRGLMNRASVFQSIHNFQSIDWNSLLTEHFAQDIWHLPGIVENYPKISRQNMYFDKIKNPYIKLEFKYFFMCKLLSKEYSPTSLTHGFNLSLSHLSNFLNANNLNIQSILELEFEKTLVQLRTWLSEYGYSQRNHSPILFKTMYAFYLRWYDVRDEYEKEIWDLRKLYPDSEQPKYVGNMAWYLNFTFINNSKLCNMVKRFYKMRVATRCLQTVYKELRYLKHFIKFIQEKHPHIDSFSLLARCHMEEFYIWLAGQVNQYGKLTSQREKRYAVQYLKIVFDYLQRVCDKDAPVNPLIYPEDICGAIKRNPRFIPDTVFKQLQDNLYLLVPSVRNAVIIIMNVGMRASELLTLKEDCISYDQDGSPWIQYYMSKMHKEHRVPTNQEVVDAVIAQCPIAAETPDPMKEKYLFRNSKGLLQYQRIKSELRKLSNLVPITDSNGSVYYITFHQFRHTVGTRMINAGVPITSVQKYLGHESPEMTMVYAHIYDNTLKEDFEKVIKNHVFAQINTGNISDEFIKNEVNCEMEWFKHNLFKNALSNGYCLHHPKHGGCPHANVCLTCPKFTTSSTFAPVLKQQLELTEKLVEDARNRGWDRELEHQTNISSRLKEIIFQLENK